MWECYHSLAPYYVNRRGRIVKHPAFLEFPNDCPLSYAVLSASCLAVDPRDRPNFLQIGGVLEDLSAHLRGEGLRETRAAHVPMRVLESHGAAGAVQGAADVEGAAGTHQCMHAFMHAETCVKCTVVCAAQVQQRHVWGALFSL